MELCAAQCSGYRYGREYKRAAHKTAQRHGATVSGQAISAFVTAPTAKNKNNNTRISANKQRANSWKRKAAKPKEQKAPKSKRQSKSSKADCQQAMLTTHTYMRICIHTYVVLAASMRTRAARTTVSQQGSSMHRTSNCGYIHTYKCTCGIRMSGRSWIWMYVSKLVFTKSAWIKLQRTRSVFELCWVRLALGNMCSKFVLCLLVCHTL